MRFLVRGDIRPGATLAPLANTPELQYHNVGGLFDPLRQSASDRDGSGVLLANLFKVVADYFIKEIMAAFDVTALTGRQVAEIENSVFNRMLYGHGLLTVWGNNLISVSPRYYWPIMDQGITIGSALVIPYSTKSSGLNAADHVMPDRALVSEHIDGQPSAVFTALYSGITLGASFARAQQDLSAVCVFGDGRSDFPQITSLVNSINDTMKAAVKIVERHSQPHLQLPSALVQYDNDGKPAVNLSKEGNVFPLNPNDVEPKYLDIPSSSDLVQYVIEIQLNMLQAITCLPPTVFNILPLPRMESGVSLEKLAAPSNERAKSLIDELERCLKALSINAPRITQEETQDVRSQKPNS